MSECKGNIYLMREGNDDAKKELRLGLNRLINNKEMGELFNISEITT